MAQAQRKAAVRQASRTSSATPTPISTPAGSSVFAETPYLDRATGLVGMQGSLFASEDPQEAGQRTYTALTGSGVRLASVHAPITISTLEEGAVLLEYLLNTYVQHGQLAYARWATTDCDSFVGNDIITRAACSAVDAAMKTLNAEPAQDKFSAMSRFLFENTKQELRLPISGADGAFDAALAGDNLRWETVGLYANEMGHLLAESSELTAETKAMTHALYSTAVKCEQICEKLGQINDLTLWLLIQASCLATW